jgi:hypothetical protein
MRKSKGINLLRLVAGQAIRTKRYASFTHEEIKEILEEVDKVSPRTHRTPPKHTQQKAKE